MTLWLPGAAAVTSVPGFAMTMPGAWVALLVQLLGTAIGAFSARYLEGEPGQGKYVCALAAVLAAVHALLLADHWLTLIAAWSAVGIALQKLLCFYPDRPFALLAAHKKRLADRAADVLLVVAAALAWWQVGSGSLSELQRHLAQAGASIALQASAACLVLAVILRTALLPVHGWLIQVMEAPTPVSALLHAGVVNLGGFVLIRFAPLLEEASPARWLLVLAGLATAALAGLVMLTRISIKVRLAWSTVAQMGFMLLECGLGLYTLALLHLIGHSLYKAHSFLASSTIVRQSRLLAMRGRGAPGAPSLALAPVGSAAIVVLTQSAQGAAWPWWWSGVLALAWAPLLWLPAGSEARWRTAAWQAAVGAVLVAMLTALAGLAHALPLGAQDSPNHAAGPLAFAVMGAVYLCLVSLHVRAHALAAWRRWSYAGFYVDEFYTRLALRLWPARWGAASSSAPLQMAASR
jgi:NAD(P)H-quinone oxidoreductase subunit 5